MLTTNNTVKKVCLLGASFDTGNLGVSALAESSIKCILYQWPNAEITLFANGYTPEQRQLNIANREIYVQVIPVRFCKNVFLPYHFLWFVIYGLLMRVLPGSWANEILLSRNPYIRTLYEADLAVDITAGDSFSDLYGMRRFLLNFLCKWLIIAYRKKFVLLPQTYGPYNRRLTRVLAKYILNHATILYSRDRNSVEFVKELLNNKNTDGKIRFLPDVAFILDARRPDNTEISLFESIGTRDTVIIGLNISGLLYHGGYTRNNMFNLRADYACLIRSIIDLLMKYKNIVVLLVPHVFTSAEDGVESDPKACLETYEWAKKRYHGRVFIIRGKYNHNEIKYIIGLCDFFIGSRMHACIAALSQGIPAISLAYSKKFAGVFETVNVEQLIVDMRYTEAEEALNMVLNGFEQRNMTAERLKTMIPKIQQQILNMLVSI
jgi:colanic acid/amylovoran biosynthesis protein